MFATAVVPPTPISNRAGPVDIEPFHRHYNVLPDAMLLVSGTGEVLAASQGVARRLQREPLELVGRPLTDLVNETPEDVLRYLRACSRSRDMVPGTLTLRAGKQSVLPCRVEGAVFVPRNGQTPARILLRLVPKDTPDRFALLSRQVEQLNREVARRRQVEDELRRSQEWFEVTLNSIGEAVIATDINGRVTFLNPVAEAMTGWCRAEAQGRPLEDVFCILDEQTREVVESPVAQVLRHGKVSGLANHTVLVSRVGCEWPIDDRGAPIRDSFGRLIGVVLVFHDVSQRRELERQLSDRATQLSEEISRRDHYLAVLAHELRNPLGPIRNALHILEQPGVPESMAQQGRQIMRRQVQQLARLIDDLLDLAFINHGQFQLRSELLDFSALISKALESSRSIVEDHRHKLHFQAEPNLMVKADPVRVEQVLANLLSNAAKFTPPGGQIWVTVSREDTRAVLRVRDTGVGIPPSKLREIFTPFAHVGRSLSGAVQWGLGVGLNIVQNIVNLLGGTVEASSDGPNRGSEFVVRLPLRLTVPELAIGAEAARTTHSLRVLVVDDSRDAADSLAMMLNLLGHQARVAYDGSSALQLADRLKPQVALLDLSMPGMDGFDLAKALRQQSGSSSLVLVALTGYDLVDESRNQSAGFIRHLVKPVDPDRLQRLLQELAEGMN